MIKHLSLVLMLITLAISTTDLQAKKHYVDPINGDMNNDGSYNAPWHTLEEIMEGTYIRTQRYTNLPYSSESILSPKNSNGPIIAGDTIMLRTGYHGRIFLRGAYMEDYLTIMAQPGEAPVIGSIQLSAAEKFIFDGIIFTPEAAPEYFNATLFFLESHGYHGPSKNVIIRNCSLYATSNSDNWGLEEWNSVGSCISMKGDSVLVENNTCLNVKDGINLSGSHSAAINNQIINFAGDGMRGQASHLLFENNVIKNCYNVNDNHDDAFQSFTNGVNPITHVTLRGNTIINYEDPNQPFRGALQGIGCFDGPYEDWVIENNLVIVNHFHGITLMGAYNSKIINNTIIDRDPSVSPNGTWLRLADQKNGDSGANNIVQNNIAFGLSLNESVTNNNNIKITDYDHFINGVQLDFRLKSTSSAVDAGMVTGAPTIDMYGTNRVSDNKVDLGAIEHNGTTSCENNNVTIHKNLGHTGIRHIDGTLHIKSPILVLPYTSHDFQLSQYFKADSTLIIPSTVTFSVSMDDCN